MHGGHCSDKALVRHSQPPVRPGAAGGLPSAVRRPAGGQGCLQPGHRQVPPEAEYAPPCGSAPASCLQPRRQVPVEGGWQRRAERGRGAQSVWRQAPPNPSLRSPTGCTRVRGWQGRALADKLETVDGHVLGFSCRSTALLAWDSCVGRGRRLACMMAAGCGHAPWGRQRCTARRAGSGSSQRATECAHPSAPLPLLRPSSQTARKALLQASAGLHSAAGLQGEGVAAMPVLRGPQLRRLQEDVVRLRHPDVVLCRRGRRGLAGKGQRLDDLAVA